MSLPTTGKSLSLTNYPLGSFRELVFLSLPLFMSLVFLYLTNICDRFFLSRYSLLALEACAGASYLASLFQVPCMRMTSTAQILVGRFRGAEQPELTGIAVWQMIWISLFTTLLTLPLGLFTASYFFSNTSIKTLGSPYFTYLIGGNFLFPLGSALASFFIGQGRMSIVTGSMLLTLIVHSGLDKILIFGISTLIPPLGMKGAAFSTLIAQSLYCLILFTFFLRPQERKSYGTGQWQIRKKLLKESLGLGWPRALSRLIILSAWTAVVAILTHQGENYLLVLSITGSFTLFFASFNEALGQGLITIVSFIIGAKAWNRLFQTIKSAFLGLFCTLTILSLFLIGFPEKLITLFYPQLMSSLQLTILIRACWGLWLYFLFEGIAWIGLSFLTAFGRTRFIMLYQLATGWIFNYCPVYIAFSLLKWPPEMLWVLMTIPCLMAGIVYTSALYNFWIKVSKEAKSSAMNVAERV